MWFKWFKKSIEIPKINKKEVPNDRKIVKMALQKNLEVMRDLNINISSLSERLSSIRQDIHMLDQRFDLLTDMLGIEIAADCLKNPPRAFVKSMSDKSLFANSKKYIDATITAERFLVLSYKLMKQQTELMKDINWR
jgi:hypothetical protein